MIITVRRAALVLAALAAVVGTSVHVTPAAAAPGGAQSHRPVRTALADAGALRRSRYPIPADADTFARAPAVRVGMTGAHTSAHRSVGGIVVGVVVLAILIGTSYLLHRRRRRRFRRNEPDRPDEPRG